MNPLGCAGELATEVGGGIMEQFSRSMADAAAAVMTSMLTFWVDDASGALDSVVLSDAQSLLLPLVGIVALLALFVGAAKIAIARKADPLFRLGVGLFWLVFWTGAGAGAVIGAVAFADALSDHILDRTTGGALQTRMGTILTVAAVREPLLMFLLALVIFAVSFVLWILAFLRIGSLYILVGVAPLAAATSMTESMGDGLRKVVGWMLAMVAFKPTAAFIYGVGFLLMGEGQSLAAVLTGVTVLILAVIALPALMKFFSFAVDSAAPKLSGFGKAAGSAVGAAATGASMYFMGSSMAAGHAAKAAASGSAGSTGVMGGLPSMAPAGVGGGSGGRDSSSSGASGAGGGGGPAAAGSSGGSGSTGGVTGGVSTAAAFSPPRGSKAS